VQFEKLYQELEFGMEMIQALTAGVTPDEARFKPDSESWSILEVLCHLCDEEREDFRQRLDYTLHRQGEKWPPIDPGGWVASRNYNDQDLAETLAGFLVERRKSLEWLKTLTSPAWDTAYQAHFGPIRAGDILSAWVAHDNLHARQLVELRRAWIIRITSPYDVRYAGDW